jgi:hypothetical protein
LVEPALLAERVWKVTRECWIRLIHISSQNIFLYRTGIGKIKEPIPGSCYGCV